MSVLTDLSSGAVGGLLGGIGTLVKDLRVAITGIDPEKAAVIEAKLMDLESASINAQMEMIKAEASSQDKWTSRARPMFMYVFYIILMLLGVITPFIAVLWPQYAAQYYTNVKAGFAAIPADLYALFGAGYLGYTGFRSFEKVKGATK